jgi:chitodextrinase
MLTWRHLLLGALLAATCLAGGASTASAVVVHKPDGQFVGVTPRRGVNPETLRGVVRSTRAQQGNDLSSFGTLGYGGGPVIHSSAPYLIFWDPSGHISLSSKQLLSFYFTHVASDSGTAGNVYAVARQYYDSAGFADYKQSFAPQSQVILDFNPYPALAGGCPSHIDPTFYPTCLTDGQLQAELQGLISARGLPSGIGPGAPIYFIVTPRDVNVCSDAANCADNTFCAYHSYVAGNLALYAVVPLFFAAGQSPAQDPKACQADGTTTVQEPNGDSADVALKYLSHEDNEVLTDPLGTAWFNGTTSNENGDECNAYAASANPTQGLSPNAFAPALGSTGTGLYNQLIGGRPYYLQSEWSNGDVGCELRPPASTVLPSFTAPQRPQGVGFPIGFDPSASVSTQSLTSTTWSFGDGSSVFIPGPGSQAVVTHAFAAAGVYTVTLTQVDTKGNLATASRQVTVVPAPKAGFAVNPAHPRAGFPVDFDGSASRDPAGPIIAYRWTFGDNSPLAAGVAPRHTYRVPGSYPVTLTVTGSSGLTGSTTLLVHVAVARTITGVSTQSTKRGTFLLVRVDAAGVVSAGSKRVRLSRAGTARFKVDLNSGQRRTLAQRHKVSVTLVVRFVPVAGTASTRTVTVTIRQ